MATLHAWASRPGVGHTSPRRDLAHHRRPPRHVLHRCPDGGSTRRAHQQRTVSSTVPRQVSRAAGIKGGIRLVAAEPSTRDDMHRCVRPETLTSDANGRHHPPPRPLGDRQRERALMPRAGSLRQGTHPHHPIPPLRRHNPAVRHRPHGAVHQQPGGKIRPPCQDPATHLRQQGMGTISRRSSRVSKR